MSNDQDDHYDYDELIQQIAAEDWLFQQQVNAGLVTPAEIKAREAYRAELIAALDEARGTADVIYSQFRDAFDRGASCWALFELRNRMHPKDPLKVAANEDLRSVGCYSPKSIRTNRDAGDDAS